jgi:adenosylcobalamin-dependent ribonucleoside-triphosphate reductase
MLKLSDNFISQYQGKQPNWGFGDLSYFVFKRTYARKKPNGTQEEYWETCQRVVEGVFKIQYDHCVRMGLPWQAQKAQASAQKMYRKIWEFKFTPPGRGLWVMGSPIVDKLGSAALCNCGFVSTKDIRKRFSSPFRWAMDMLMLGVGVGFDAKGAGGIVVTPPNADDVSTFVIPDSREGWVEAVELLIDSFDGRGRGVVEFDYSKIRKAGEPIKGFGGTASGPEPLAYGIEAIRSLLNAQAGQEITSVTIVDIMNFIGKLVVSGNIRRSAEVAIGAEDDLDFIQMKDPDLFQDELRNRRWASNNAIFATPESDFSRIVKNIMKNGEPGLIFLGNARHYGRLKDGWNPENSSKFDDCEGANPCVEQFLYHLELCNLAETYPANHDSLEEYLETLKYAFLYAKSVTLLPTHDADTNQVMLQNRRIGLSMSGIQQAIKKFGSAEFFSKFCDQGYEVVSHWDRIYSRWLGIPTSLKKTTVKPSGSVSLLAGATPGVHCTHSEFYMRAIRFSATSPLLLGLLKAGYLVEFDVQDKDKLKQAGWTGGDVLTLGVHAKHTAQFKAFTELGGTLVVYFPVQEQNFTKSKADISIWEQLCLARELQDKWSDNSVSITVTFKDNEFNDLKSAIEYMAPYVKSLSFLPLEDHNYAQAPYQTCTKDEYDEYQGSLKRLRRGNIPQGERYCTNDICDM